MNIAKLMPLLEQLRVLEMVQALQDGRETHVAEVVTLGHPDTVCDYLAAAIVDDRLAVDPFAHVAVDVTLQGDLVIVAGTIGSPSRCPVEAVVREALDELGLRGAWQRWDARTVRVVDRVQQEIRESAGPAPFLQGERSGIVHGFATRHTADEAPAAAGIAHAIQRKLEARRSAAAGPVIGQVQVGVDQDPQAEFHLPGFVVVQLWQPVSGNTAKVVKSIVDEAVSPSLPRHWRGNRFPVRVQVTPIAEDAVGELHGASGRHAIRAAYGGMIRTSDSVVSGRTPDHREVLHAYTARWLALHAVRASRAQVLELGLESIPSGAGTHTTINAYTTGHVTWIGGHLRMLDTDPESLIERFGLRRPIHRDLVRHGWIGRRELPWEQSAA